MDSKLEMLIKSISEGVILNYFKSKDNFKIKGKKEGFLERYNRDNLLKTLNRCGNFDFGIEILTVIFGEVNRELNSRSGKKLQYDITKDIIKGEKSDGAISIFYDSDGDFRISLVLSDYRGKKRDFTSYKRYTYFIDSKKTNKTFRSQIKKVNFSSIDNIKEGFSIEPVTKEFFDRYREIFNKFNKFSYGEKDQIRQNYQKIFPEIDPTSGKFEKKIRDFNKKLLGRLVFLKFLEKKGWLGATDETYSDGDQNFLSNLFNQVENRDSESDQHIEFYQYNLIPLFYNTLNNPKVRDFKSFYIPFLNGGLFEKKDGEDNIVYPNYLFKDLLELFDQYNFTVDENSLIDQEIAVDPEMLGHIFENLLEDNKDKGAFYTPKEIVDYMTRSSILEYLKNFYKGEREHEALEDLVFYPEVGEFRKGFIKTNRDNIIKYLDEIKILDPAIGSGAFPVGILHVILQLKESLLDHNINRADEKRKIIENSIYGVDIDKGAVDIARLRFWLSLIVDQDKPIPLPNLDFKIVTGNSLITQYKGDVVDINLSLIGKLKDDFNKLTKDFYNIKDPKEKKRVKKDAKEIIKKIIFEHLKMEQEKTRKKIEKKINKNKVMFGEDSNEKTENKNIEKKLDPIIVNDKDIENFFDYKIMFSDVFHKKNGFDIIIGNPPYLRVQGIDRDISEKYKKMYKSATGSFDLYVLFSERGLLLLNGDGILNYIIPHKWVNSAFGKGLRKISKDNFYKMISFGAYQVFNASTYTSLIWFKKIKNEQVKYIELKNDLKTNYELKEYLDNLNKESYSYINKDLFNESWILVNKNTNKILEKIYKQPLKVIDIFKRVFTGLQTSKDSVYFLYDCIEIDHNLIEGESKELKKRIKIEKEFVKPLLKGDDVHRYQQLYTKKVVIFPYKIINNDAILYTEKEIENLYPNGYKYLKDCEDILRARENNGFNDKNWYRFGRNQGIKIAEQEKLIQPDISLSGNYCYDEKGEFYQTTTLYGYIKYKNIKSSYKFYLSILNSNLLWWFLVNTGTTLANGYFRFMPRYINPFPLPEIKNLNDQKPFEILVDKIMELKKDNKNSSFFENLIDLMVYKLYKLNYEDIKVIDPEIDKVLSIFDLDKDQYEKKSIKNLFDLSENR